MYPFQDCRDSQLNMMVHILCACLPACCPPPGNARFMKTHQYGRRMQNAGSLLSSLPRTRKREGRPITFYKLARYSCKSRKACFLCIQGGEARRGRNPGSRKATRCLLFLYLSASFSFLKNYWFLLVAWQPRSSCFFLLVIDEISSTLY